MNTPNQLLQPTQNPSELPAFMSGSGLGIHGNRQTGAYGLKGLVSDEVADALQQISDSMDARAGITPPDVPAMANMSDHSQTSIDKVEPVKQPAGFLTIESAQAIEDPEFCKSNEFINDAEDGIFAMFEETDDTVNQAVYSYINALRDDAKPLATAEDLAARVQEAGQKAGLLDTTLKFQIATIEEIAGKQYLAFINGATNSIGLERIEANGTVGYHQLEGNEHDDIGVVEIKPDDCFALYSSGITDKNKGVISQEQLAKAYENTTNSQEIADNLLREAQGSGKKAVITIDAYDPANEESDQSVVKPEPAEQPTLEMDKLNQDEPTQLVGAAALKAIILDNEKSVSHGGEVPGSMNEQIIRIVQQMQDIQARHKEIFDEEDESK